MRAKTFVTAFDTTDPRFDATAIGRFVTSDSDTAGWWKHIPGVYMLNSTLSAREITTRLKPICEDVSFLVSEAHVSETVGWLPRQSWDWIVRRRAEELHPDSVPAEQTPH